MSNWIPVVGTLLGATIAGAISILISWLSNRRAAQNTKLLLAEERAKWAAEKRLERLQNFYSVIEKMLDATIQFRVQQAWQASADEEPDLEPPEWVSSYDKARGDWEGQLGVIARALLFQDEIVQAEFEKSNIKWLRWLGTKTKQEGVQALVGMEEDIQKFSKWIANRYREQFEGRYRGADHAL